MACADCQRLCRYNCWPNVKGTLPALWDNEQAEKHFDKIAPATMSYLRENMGDSVEVDMVAPVTVAKKK